MFNIRAKGLYQLQGLIIVFILPFFFSFYAYVSAEYFHKFHYDMVNYPLYWMGALVSGIISLAFYDRLERMGPRFNWFRVVKVSNRQTLVLLIVMFTLIFATKDKGMSRIFMGSFILFSWFFFIIMNNLLPKLLSQMVFQGANVRRCLLIGSTAACKELEDWMLSHASIGLSIAGYLDIEQEDKDLFSKIPYLGSSDGLDAEIKKLGINQVIILETKDSKEWIQDIVNICNKNACRLLIYNPWRKYFDQPLIAIQEGVHTFFTFKDEPLESPINRFFKRLLDLAISIPICVTILPVLCILVFIAQMCEARGPLFFKQERIGFNRKKFQIYKFRSMVHQPESKEEGMQATEGDKRIFHFGSLIRRYSIDEFPQFLNVLLGHMSVVGPRPHFIGHDKLFTRYIGHYRQRHFAKPGITGLAQSKGYRGEITDLELLRERTHYDLEYIDNWSLSLDVSIVLRTIWQVIFPPKTAY